MKSHPTPGRRTNSAKMVIPTIAGFGRRGRQVWTQCVTSADDAGGQESALQRRSQRWGAPDRSVSTISKSSTRCRMAGIDPLRAFESGPLRAVNPVKLP